MGSSVDIIAKLNYMLEAEEFDGESFDYMFKHFKELFNPEVYILDFSFFNEDRLKVLWKEKISLIRNQEFEKAAIVREMEKECQTYIDTRIEDKIEKSAFVYDDGVLFYLCIGSNKQDKYILLYLEYIT
jgi:hypothetical protein